jgi:hypothetical protein
VEAHGGEIRIDSVLEKGTTVTVTLLLAGSRFDRQLQNHGNLRVQKSHGFGLAGS